MGDPLILSKQPGGSISLATCIDDVPSHHVQETVYKDKKLNSWL